MLFLLYKNIWNIISYKIISNKTWIKKETVKNIISYLEDIDIILKINSFNYKLKKDYIYWFKIYFSNIIFINYFKNKTLFELELWKIIENLSLLEIYKNKFKWIYFFRSKNWNEIDFILEWIDSKYTPIEIKSKNSISIPKWFYEFDSMYKDKINFYIKSTIIKKKKKNFWKNKIFFIPIIYLKNINL